MQGGHMLRIATIGTSMITDDFIQVVNANDQATFVGLSLIHISSINSTPRS